MKAKEFIPPSKPRNFVVKHQKTAGAGAHRDKKKEQKQGYEKHKGRGVSEGSHTTEKQILTRIRQIMYDRKLSGTESNAGELHSLKQQLKDIRSQQGVSEGFFGIDDSIKGKIQNITNKISDVPGNWDHKAQEFTPAGLEELKTALHNKSKYIKYALSLTANDYDESIKMERVRDPEDWDEGNTEPPNNFAVYINGKKWKVFKGRGQFADDYKERDHYRQLQNWAQAKSAATGKEWKVYVTGEQATESVEEGWKEKLAAAGLAGAMAFGAAGPAQARVSPDGEGGFTPSAAQMIKATDKADQAKDVVPLSKRYDSRYEGSPEAGMIKVDGKLYKFAGRTADAPGKGEKIKVPAGAVGIRGLGAVTVELDDGKYYQTTPD